MPEAGQPEQLPARPRLALADSSAAEQAGRRPRPLEVAQCGLCGIARPLALLIPDGGGACADVRWYCKDVESCTARWTAIHSGRSAYLPVIPGFAVADAAEPATAGTPTEPLGGTPEEAQPVT
jgi:hypothetical protein